MSSPTLSASSNNLPKSAHPMTQSTLPDATLSKSLATKKNSAKLSSLLKCADQSSKAKNAITPTADSLTLSISLPSATVALAFSVNLSNTSDKANTSHRNSAGPERLAPAITPTKQNKASACD